MNSLQQQANEISWSPHHSEHADQKHSSHWV